MNESASMDMGEWITRGTVWLALLLYVASEVVLAVDRPQSRIVARGLNLFGWIIFLAHVLSAFHFYHGWSHAAAYAETARQTSKLFGWNWGGGLYLNYLFTLIWLAAIVWTWTTSGVAHPRPGWMTWSLRGLFLFMMLNGAVVFARGPVRWFGLILCLTLVCSWTSYRRRTVDSSKRS